MDRFSGEGMAKAIATRRLLFHELFLDKVSKGTEHLLGVVPGHADQHAVLERAAEDGCRTYDVRLCIAHALDPEQDRLLDGRREAKLTDRLAVPTAGSREDIASIERHLEQLFEDERIALGPLVKEVAQIRFDRRVVKDRADHLPHPAGRQGLEIHHFGGTRSLPTLDQR